MSSRRTFTFLGTGTSVGVPMLGCACPTCTSTDPRNQRYRASALVTTERGRILIDTTPELRLQLLRAKVPLVHAVLFTHYHADHLFGLDDVRLFPRALNGPLPLFCDADTEEKIRQTFAYAFTPEAEGLPYGVLPRLSFVRIEDEPFEVLGETVLPVPLHHAQFRVLGFRFGGLAYCTDVSGIPEQSWTRLQGLDVLILGALRKRPHPAHFSLDQALAVIRELRPRRAYLTHLSHELEHEQTSRELPPGVELAYDGLTLEF
ncbi:MAG: MBL fold metallo-hydrolase [Gemmatales bacterium]|nr:MBL fold metallo-hydrolase [Gemmatales bacterium]MDW8388241.1 MBL fold metallo-hydrolase [Gemmatales bacterium]